MHGSNSEISWNKEGSRRCSVIPRTTPKTALTLVADRAAALGEELNDRLQPPANTRRERILQPKDEDTKFENVPKLKPSDVDQILYSESKNEFPTTSTRPSMTPKTAELCAAIRSSSASRKRLASKLAAMQSLSPPNNGSISPRKTPNSSTLAMQLKRAYRRRKSDVLGINGDEHYSNENGHEQSKMEVARQDSLGLPETTKCAPTISSIASTLAPPPVKIIRTPSVEVDEQQVTETASTSNSENRTQPPKVNVLSQQTITKNSINYVPLENNKIVVKHDSKLANALRTQNIQMIPSAKFTVPSAMASKMVTLSDLSARNFSTKVPKIVPHTTVANHFQRQVSPSSSKMYVVTESPSIPAFERHTIEKIVADESSIEIVATETDDIIIEETGTYEIVEESDEPFQERNITYISTSPTTQSHVTNDSNQQQIINGEIMPSTIVYQPTTVDETDWQEYESNDSNKSNGNIQTYETQIVHEYQDPSIVYAEEEVIEEENITEEFVTTEIYAADGSF